MVLKGWTSIEKNGLRKKGKLRYGVEGLDKDKQKWQSTCTFTEMAPGQRW
jgi:hypothetical protein